MDEDKSYLNPPPVKPVEYQTNFIKTAVCELRFPTLLELETAPPRAFQAKIRKAYPFYETQITEQVGVPEGIAQEHSYLFLSKDRRWTVTVKSSSISLQTSQYTNFENFVSRFTELLDHARDMIDSDFFTRVGLRYINMIPYEGGTPEGWIRPELISLLTSDVLGTTKSCISQTHGLMNNGQYTIRHGFKDDSGNYTLDFDYFQENIEFPKVVDLITSFNQTNFALFSWCLGEKAKQVLGEGKPK